MLSVSWLLFRPSLCAIMDAHFVGDKCDFRRNSLMPKTVLCIGCDCGLYFVMDRHFRGARMTKLLLLCCIALVRGGAGYSHQTFP